MLVYLLWGLVVCNVTFAGSMLLAHIVIPSLQATGHVKQSASVARPILTVVALVALAGTACVVFNFLQYLPILYQIYPHKII